MFKLTPAMLDPNSGGTHYGVEASSMELRPGDFPQLLEVELHAHGMEPAMAVAFERTSFERYEGDVIAAHYRSALGTYVLTVWND